MNDQIAKKGKSDDDWEATWSTWPAGTIYEVLMPMMAVRTNLCWRSKMGKRDQESNYINLSWFLNALIVLIQGIHTDTSAGRFFV